MASSAGGGAETHRGFYCLTPSIVSCLCLPTADFHIPFVALFSAAQMHTFQVIKDWLPSLHNQRSKACSFLADISHVWLSGSRFVLSSAQSLISFAWTTPTAAPLSGVSVYCFFHSLHIPKTLAILNYLQLENKNHHRNKNQEISPVVPETFDGSWLFLE